MKSFVIVLVLLLLSAIESKPVIVNKNVSSVSIVHSHSFENRLLGQISGLATSNRNPDELVIFHRGKREWNQDSFPDDYHFNTKKFHSIEENTIASLNISSNQITNQWANKTFFMPHGLFIDHEENLWLTDVAMHQVFKYKNEHEMLKLGELFVPAIDRKHFCKPTDVVISKENNDIYVADGYCNSRIIQFNANGTFIKEFQMKKKDKQLWVPHSLTIIYSLRLICVADRQNGRIVCFDLDKGNVRFIITNPKMNSVYAIIADENKNVLYAVSGKDFFNDALGFTFNINSNSFGDLIQTWKSTNDFGEPHDLALSQDGKHLFVATIRPNRLQIFNISSF